MKLYILKNLISVNIGARTVRFFSNRSSRSEKGKYFGAEGGCSPLSPPSGHATAKAFDKVDHDLLLKKVVKHGIKGKIGMWLREFLSNRKFTVIANGTMSDQEDVLSGVPQGTVLAALLFIIMISDIDENIKESIVRCFADDTRVSKKIEKEDKKKLQDDLNRIYKWAEDNLMIFN